MKVLFISAAFPPMRAGEADHALQLCLRLAERGETLQVLTSKGALDGRRFPFTVHPVMRDWSWTDLPRLARFIKRCRPDAITLLYSGWIYNDHPMITFAPTVAKRIFPSVPFVTMLAIEEGSNWGSLPTRAIRKAAQFWAGSKTVDYVFGTLLRDSDSVIAWSENHLARFSELSPTVVHKGLVIPPPPLMRMCPEDNGATRERGRARLNVNQDEFLLAFFGYIDRNKGIETLFKATQLVSANGHNVRVVMIGGGRKSTQTASNQRARTVLAYEQEMLRCPEQLGIGTKVIWLNGYDSDSDEGSLYLHAADACVLPFEQGVTLNRSSFAAAAAHGLPIISTRGDKLESAFKDQQNVFLCPPRDAQALAMAIQSLIRDPALRQQLRKGAAQLADEWFSWERAVDRTIQTFRTRPPSQMDVPVEADASTRGTFPRAAAATNRMAHPVRVGIFDHWSHYLGGGQLVVARMAAQLSENYQVDIIHCGRGYAISGLASAFDVDLSKARERVVPDSLGSLGLPGRQATWTALPSRLKADRALTAPYDLFIYVGHGVPPFNSARRGVIYCHFPFEGHPIHDLKLTEGWHDRSAPSRWGRLIIYRLLWKYRMRGYQIVQCNSQFTAHWINRLWYTPAEVLYPPVALEIPSTTKRNAIVSIGRFVQSDNKNHAQQLRAFREFYSLVGGDWRLYMIGFCADISHDRAYVQNLRDLALGLPVTFVVNAERKAVIDRLAEAKLFWHATGLGNEPQAPPRSQEHFGIATVEAMLAGCVPLVPRGGGQTEIVEHGDNGFLCRNMDELVMHAICLANDDDMRSRMSRRAIDRGQCFSVSAFEERFALSLKRILAEREVSQEPERRTPTVALKSTDAGPKTAS